MFCRGVWRLSVATFDPAFKPSGLVHVKANRLGYITWTLPNKYTSHCCRALFKLTGSLDSSFLHRIDESKTYITVKNGESSSGFITTDLKHFNRVATIASNHTEDVQKVRYEDRGDGANRCSDRKAAETVASVVFWGGARLCTPSGSRSSMTVQTRASSTAAATQKGEKEPMETDNREEQHLKEPPASSSSLASSSAGPGETEPEGGKPNKTQQLKKVFKEYGAVGVTFHVGISLISLGMFYLLVSSGFDMAAVLCKLGFSEAVVRSKMAAGTSTFVLAYAVHKLFAPARISITLVSVPFIVRHFRKTGLFKPPTPAP